MAQVNRDGSLLRSYRYDSFSNRIQPENHVEGRTCAFTYDVRNRLVVMEDGVTRKEYTYDHRGNLTGEMEGGTLLHGYASAAVFVFTNTIKCCCW